MDRTLRITKFGFTSLFSLNITLRHYLFILVPYCRAASYNFLGFYSAANEDYTFALRTERKLFTLRKKSGSPCERESRESGGGENGGGGEGIEGRAIFVVIICAPTMQ